MKCGRRGSGSDSSSQWCSCCFERHVDVIHGFLQHVLCGFFNRRLLLRCRICFRYRWRCTSNITRIILNVICIFFHSGVFVKTVILCNWCCGFSKVAKVAKVAAIAIASAVAVVILKCRFEGIRSHSPFFLTIAIVLAFVIFLAGDAVEGNYFCVLCPKRRRGRKDSIVQQWRSDVGRSRSDARKSSGFGSGGIHRCLPECFEIVVTVGWRRNGGHGHGHRHRHRHSTTIVIVGWRRRSVGISFLGLFLFALW
mmetsp:Transcript_1781/g.4152  ORF Transcript_1781/g.4152 Transcript_1781/m.4152 type:complete len:253 (-) Transcript_1781:42-800(-)